MKETVKQIKETATKIYDKINKKKKPEVSVPIRSLGNVSYDPKVGFFELKGGRKKTSEKKFFPGYLLVKTELNEESWHFLRNIPKVIGFVGGKIKDGKLDPESVPTVDESEINKMRNKIEEGTLKPTPKVIFDTGESVKVIEGPFENFTGVVEEVKMDKGKIQVLVEIFGRATPIDLDFNQVEKI